MANCWALILFTAPAARAAAEAEGPHCQHWCNGDMCASDKCNECAFCSLPRCASWCDVCGGEGIEACCSGPSGKLDCALCPACIAPPNPPPAPKIRLAVPHNPFLSPSGWYINPAQRSQIGQALEHAPPAAQPALRQLWEADVPTAVWIDSKAKLPALRATLSDAATRVEPPLVVLVHYNLPNRDCAAVASAGEFCCRYKPDGTCDMNAGEQCAEGVAEYLNDFVAPFAAELAAHPTVRARGAPALDVFHLLLAVALHQPRPSRPVCFTTNPSSIVGTGFERHWLSSQ